MNHWISLYLSGQYPGFYRLPNRFEILLKIRQIDGTNFGDTMMSLMKDKSDVEFYNSLLSAFESLHGATEFQKLLEDMKVPQEVRVNPNETREKVTSKPQKSYEALQLNQYIHKDLIPLFSAGIKSEILYRWAYVQAFNIINNRLEAYCNEQLWADRHVEFDAIDVIFNQNKKDNAFNFKRGTETECGMELWLKGLFEWAIKYYRNPSAHQENYLNTEREFIEAMFLLSSLLRKMEDSKIS